MADITDLTQNISIHDDTDDVAVTTTTDGSKRRLDVQALIDGGTFSLSPFVPKTSYDATGVAITTTWTTLKEITTTQGKLDFIATSTGTSNYKIRLTVDGTECFDVSMAALGSIGLSNAVNVDIWAETALKNFRYRPQAPVDFTTGYKIEAAMTTGTGTVKYMILHRERSSI